MSTCKPNLRLISSKTYSCLIKKLSIFTLFNFCFIIQKFSYVTVYLHNIKQIIWKFKIYKVNSHIETLNSF